MTSSRESPPSNAPRAERYRAARRDPALAVLEGLHALKHARRFGADILDVAVRADGDAAGLARELAPDLVEILSAAPLLPEEEFARLVPLPHPTGVVALARRPAVTAEDVLRPVDGRPAVLLENPIHLGNLGAAVRVAAAAGARGLLSTGVHDPWAPEAVRAAAGLQFALPVARLDDAADTDGTLVAVTPEGEPLQSFAMPADAVLAFGTERRGLSDELLARADRQVAIPMRSGISSLNLATAVAVVLYAWRLAAED